MSSEITTLDLPKAEPPVNTPLTKETKNTPLIMISAHPSAKDLCMNAGADDFIPKPFDMENIIARINHLLVNQSC